MYGRSYVGFVRIIGIVCLLALWNSTSTSKFWVKDRTLRLKSKGYLNSCPWTNYTNLCGDRTRQWAMKKAAIRFEAASTRLKVTHDRAAKPFPPQHLVKPKNTMKRLTILKFQRCVLPCFAVAGIWWHQQGSLCFFCSYFKDMKGCWFWPTNLSTHQPIYCCFKLRMMFNTSPSYPKQVQNLQNNLLTTMKSERFQSSN